MLKCTAQTSMHIEQTKFIILNLLFAKLSKLCLIVVIRIDEKSKVVDAGHIATHQNSRDRMNTMKNTTFKDEFC